MVRIKGAGHAGLGEFCEHEEIYIKARGALQHILPIQLAYNIPTTEKSENQLQVLDFIEVEQSKAEFSVELGGHSQLATTQRYTYLLSSVVRAAVAFV